VADADCAELRHEPGRECGARRSGASEPGYDGEKQLGHANRARLQKRSRDGFPGLSSPWPPGPNDADRWREYLAAGGPPPTQPAVRRGSARAAVLVDSIRCLGNAVVPAQARAAFQECAGRVLSVRANVLERAVQEVG
jgi:hypothetical protein